MGVTEKIDGEAYINEARGAIVIGWEVVSGEKAAVMYGTSVGIAASTKSNNCVDLYVSQSSSLIPLHSTHGYQAC